MKTMLLSDQGILQIGLQAALAEQTVGAHVFRTTQLIAAVGHASATGRLDAVIVDVGWCGLRSLAAVVQRVMGALDRVPLVVLVDRPDEVSLVRLAGIKADMFLTKTASPAVMRQALMRFAPANSEIAAA